MRHRDEAEYPAPGPEFQPPGEETLPPLPEFQEHAAAQTPPKPRKRRLLWLTAAFVTITVLGFPAKPESPAPPPPETTVTEPSAPPPVTEPPPETLPPETLPEPSTYPLADGTLDITVYNGSPDMERNGENKLLYQAVIPEAEFTGLTLPPYEPQEGFQFLGFVLRADAGGLLLAEALSPEDTALVRPEENGVRKIVIVGAWCVPDSEEPWMPLTLYPGYGTSPVTIDATGPLYSGATVYLCAFPRPERVGFLFAGWYRDEAGTDGPVESISAEEFFGRDEEGNILWKVHPGITLYARWIPE